MVPTASYQRSIKIVFIAVGHASRRARRRLRGAYNEGVRDIVYTLVVIGFFVLAALFVRACTTIVGAEVEEAPER